jgi:hypothetical protein
MSLKLPSNTAAPFEHHNSINHKTKILTALSFNSNNEKNDKKSLFFLPDELDAGTTTLVTKLWPLHWASAAIMFYAFCREENAFHCHELLRYMPLKYVIEAAALYVKGRPAMNEVGFKVS